VPNRELRIGNLLDAGVLRVSDGYRAKNSELGSEGLPFARAANVRDGFQLGGADLLLPASIERAGDKLSRPGDVVFTSKGTVGRFALVSNSDPEFVYSPQLCFWRVLDDAIVLPTFLFFWMHGDECRRQFNALKGQTDMADYISLRDQRLIAITLPDVAEQRRVAGVLTALTDAIRVAFQIRTRLGALCEELFEHEVIHNSGSWVAQSLPDLARFVNGRNFTKGAEGTGRPVVRIKELNSGLGPSTVLGSALEYQR
jgi:type I restriction enzyme S subunit